MRKGSIAGSGAAMPIERGKPDGYRQTFGRVADNPLGARKALRRIGVIRPNGGNADEMLQAGDRANILSRVGSANHAGFRQIRSDASKHQF
jgi:hypothetical protein